MRNIVSAQVVDEEVSELVEEMFTYHPWNEDQIARGSIVRDVLAQAVREIIANVPPSADRTVAIRKIREARMDCNSAITHNGNF